MLIKGQPTSADIFDNTITTQNSSDINFSGDGSKKKPLSAVLTDTVKNNISEALATAKDAETNAQDAQIKAENALNTANEANATASEAKSEAENALSVANDTASKLDTKLNNDFTTGDGSKVAGADGDVLTAIGGVATWQPIPSTQPGVDDVARAAAKAAQDSANAAQKTADKAENDAQTAYQTATDAKTTANQAEMDAQTAITDAANAHNLAASATQAAANAQNTANQAKAKTDQLKALAFKDKALISDISATGTPSASTYLRGDGSWATVQTQVPAPTDLYFGQGTNYIGGFNDKNGKLLLKLTYRGSAPQWDLTAGAAHINYCFTQGNGTPKSGYIESNNTYTFGGLYLFFNGTVIIGGGYTFLIQYMNTNIYVVPLNCSGLVTTFLG